MLYISEEFFPPCILLAHSSLQDGPESPHPNLFAATQATEGAEEDRAIGTRVMGHPSGTILGGLGFQKTGCFCWGKLDQICWLLPRHPKRF